MFVRAPCPVWSFVDVDGLQLNDQYFAFFLDNVFPYNFRAIFSTPNGTVWPNPLQFYPNGTLPNNLYFDPSKVYRIEIRHGNSQTDPLVYEINDFVPGDNSDVGEISYPQALSNQATNPQFQDINFVSPLVIPSGTAGYDVDIAPGWILRLTGVSTGDTTITRVQPGATNPAINDPYYYLQITTGGWTTAELVQKFAGNPDLWSSTAANGNAEAQYGVVSMSVTAMAVGSAYPLTLEYLSGLSPINPEILPGPGNPFPQANIGTGAFEVLSGNIVTTIPTGGSSVGSEFIIVLRPSGTIRLSNAQIVGQSVPSSSVPDLSAFSQELVDNQLTYLQQTPQQQSNQVFYNYRDSIIMQPKDSVAVGWNFGLNPWQFGVVAGVNIASNAAGYTADQTIIIQQAACGGAPVGNNVFVKQGSNADNLGLTVTAVTANNQFGILQYIDPKSMAAYWSFAMSSLVKGKFITTHGTTPPKVKMRLIHNISIPGAVSAIEPVLSWAAGGDPVFNAANGWLEIKPTNDPSYSLSSTDGVFSFDNFVLPAASTGTMTLGIFVYTVGLMNEAATADYIVINDVSLVPNRFAIASNPKTFDQTIQECQFYYEKTYNNDAVAGTAATISGQIMVPQMSIWDGAANFNLSAAPFQVNFNTVKRSSSPTVTIYNPSSGAAGSLHASGWTPNVDGEFDVALATFWDLGALSSKGFYYTSKGARFGQTSALAITAQNWCTVAFHYTVSARIGV